VLPAATTPGAHPLIRTAWIAAAGLLVVGLVLLVSRAGRAAIPVLAVALALFVGGYVAYLVRHLRFLRVLERAEADLDRGDLERARVVLAPLLDRYPGLAPVQRAAGLATYALGDPLAAASLLERAARSYGDDERIAAALVASYAALNRAGDARRASALAPLAVDVRLALAWAEVVALGGDRARGAEEIAGLAERADVRGSAARRAMAAALQAVADAGRGDRPAVRSAVDAVHADREALRAYERAFLGYLEGVAWRELGSITEARAAFEEAMALEPTIGAALARRERANMLARLGEGHSSSSSQSPTSPSSSANSSGS
jgi:tetratricopeptide (TPR) repeat protein